MAILNKKAYLYNFFEEQNLPHLFKQFVLEYYKRYFYNISTQCRTD